MLEETLSAYSFGQLQDFISFYKFLVKRGITLEDVSMYVSEIRKQKTEQIEFVAKAHKTFPKCPDCNIVMVPRAVDEDDQDEGSYWICPKCRWSYLDPRALGEIHRDLRYQAKRTEE